MSWTYQNLNKGRYCGRVVGKSGLHYTVYGPDVDTKSSLLLGQEGHYGYPNFPPDRNVGGLFRLEKNEILYDWVNVGAIYRYGGNIDDEQYFGEFTAYSGMPSFTIGLSDASPYGTLAYNRMKPAQPEFSALNFIYELKDLPRMLRQRHEQLSDIGNYYLALKFGWEPLLRDIRNYVNLQRKAQDVLNQLLRDNGKPVRRRVTLQSDTTMGSPSSGVGYGAVKPILPTQYYHKEPTFVDRTTTTDRVWASGRFRYWLPPGPRDVNWTRSMMAKLFGLNPSPSVLWNALPYTWLIDWHVNVGNILENMETGVADRLASDYFYCMREKREDTQRDVNMWFKRKTGEVFQSSSTCHTIRKSLHRVNGYPFGFNISPQPLTGMQLSILGALGLSKL